MDSLLSTEVLDTYAAFGSEYSIYECREETVNTDSSEEEEQASEHELIACVKLCWMSVHVEEDEETEGTPKNWELCTQNLQLLTRCGQKPMFLSILFWSNYWARKYCLSLEWSQLDSVVLTHFQALGKDVSLPSKEKRCPKYIEICFKGKHVCRETFLFLYTLSLKRYHNQLEHFRKNGLVLRNHDNYRKARHSRMAFDDVHATVEFLKNLPTAHALPLPGWRPRHKDKALLLPSDMAKRSVYCQC